MYVGAFQYLVHKQSKFDLLHNEGISKSEELRSLLVVARNLLCEIETAMNSRQTYIFNRTEMNDKLKFRNNNKLNPTTNEIDDLDNKFTIIRFHEYLNGMHRILSRAEPMAKSLHQHKKKNSLKNSQQHTDALAMKKPRNKNKQINKNRNKNKLQKNTELDKLKRREQRRKQRLEKRRQNLKTIKFPVNSLR